MRSIKDDPSIRVDPREEYADVRELLRGLRGMEPDEAPQADPMELARYLDKCPHEFPNRKIPHEPGEDRRV